MKAVRRVAERCLLLLVVQALLLFSARAGAAGSSFIAHDCGADHCTCFIQLGDEGQAVARIVEALKLQGYLDLKTPVGVFSQAVQDAVIAFQADHGLTCTGTMDDDTLTLLLWEMLPERLDVFRPFDENDPETWIVTVYVPTDGGKRRHASSVCCGMIDPRKVSIRNAEKMGFLGCGISGCEYDREWAVYGYNPKNKKAR